ncbi:MAG: hypothetical protein WBA98_13010, partial [Gordonia sp. (in: high G+C Gram-positive bacteria)]|uniref:hypothetical protein n=1 Tax=Gordonia sp. (in: high G+C Gram-positive bacteria) TaxID=84139 RepID=UPI003C792960
PRHLPGPELVAPPTLAFGSALLKPAAANIALHAKPLVRTHFSPNRHPRFANRDPRTLVFVVAGEQQRPQDEFTGMRMWRSW